MKKSIITLALAISSFVGFSQTEMRTSKTLAEGKFNTNTISVKQSYINGEKDGVPVLIWSAVSASSNSVADNVFVILREDEVKELAIGLETMANKGEEGASIKTKKYSLLYGKGSQPISFWDDKHYYAWKNLRIKDALEISQFIINNYVTN